MQEEVVHLYDILRRELKLGSKTTTKTKITLTMFEEMKQSLRDLVPGINGIRSIQLVSIPRSSQYSRRLHLKLVEFPGAEDVWLSVSNLLQTFRTQCHLTNYHTFTSTLHVQTAPHVYTLMIAQHQSDSLLLPHHRPI